MKSWSIVLGRSSLPQCQLLLFPVNLFQRSPVSVNHQISDPSSVVTCVLKAQCLPILQQCQWSGALGKVLFNEAQTLFSLMLFPEYPIIDLPTMTNKILWIGVWRGFFNLLMIGFTIRHWRLKKPVILAWDNKGSGESCIPIDIGLLVTISCGMSLCFPRGIPWIVSKIKSNTFGQESTVVLASLV